MDKKPTQHEELAGRTAVLNKSLAASVAQNFRRGDFLVHFSMVPPFKVTNSRLEDRRNLRQTQVQNSGASLLVHPERNLHVKLSISRCACKDFLPSTTHCTVISWYHNVNNKNRSLLLPTCGRNAVGSTRMWPLPVLNPVFRGKKDYMGLSGAL